MVWACDEEVGRIESTSGNQWGTDQEDVQKAMDRCNKGELGEIRR